MQESEELRKKVITNLRACLISSQGGIPVSNLNNDYRQLLGEAIPFKRLGYNSLDNFLKSLPEVTLKIVNGTTFVEAKKTSSSNHITNLVERQKKGGRKRSRKAQNVRRLTRPKANNRLLSLPPRFRERTKISRRKEVPQKCAINDSPAASRKNNNTPSVANTAATNKTPPPLLPNPQPPYDQVPCSRIPPTPLLKTPTVPVSYCSPFVPQPGLSRQSGLYSPHPLLTPLSHIPPNPSSNLNATCSAAVRQQTADLSHQLQQIYQQQPEPIQRSPPKLTINKPLGHKSNKMPIIDRLPIPPGVHKESYYNKLMDFTKRRGWPEPEICLLRQKGGAVTGTVSVKCSKPGQPADTSIGMLDFTTYPEEITDPLKALERVSKKAFDVVADMVCKIYPVTKNCNLILDRLAEMVKEKKNGIWAFQIERDYVEKFRESLPYKWVEIVQESQVLCASNLGHSYVILPYRDEEDVKMISPYQARSQSPHQARNQIIPKLTPPEEEQWDVYISRAQSYSEIWIRLIGENYSKQLENLTTEIELYYYDDKSPPVAKVEVNKYYVAICDDSAFRILIKECYENDALVHFVDYGDDETISLKVIKELAPQFYSLPIQALLVNLSGLEFTSKLEYREDFMDRIVGNSFIGLIEERDPYYLVLYDTSDNSDIDINKMLIGNIFSDILYQPMILKAGLVKAVNISHVDDNGHVFTQLLSNPAREILNERLEAIVKGEYETVTVQVININKIYLIKYLGMVYRVIVKAPNVASKTSVDIYFIDEGKTMTVSVSDLFEVIEDYDILSSIPHQAIKIELKDIPPHKLTADKIKKLRDIALTCNQIISKVVEIADLPVVELFVRRQTDNLLFSVNHSIELEDFLDNPSETTSLQKSFQSLRITNASLKENDNSKSPKIPTVLEDKDIFSWESKTDVVAAHRVKFPAIDEKYFEIYVTEVANPTNFMIQPLKYLLKLNALTKEMKIFYDNLKPNNFHLLQYQVYAVKHSDDFWYRGVVLCLFNDNVTVKLCDYGNLEIVSLQKLRPLHKKFMELPFLGLIAKLHGIAPKHKDWSVNDCIAVKKMIKEKKLISVIKEVLYNNNDVILSLEITDTNTNTDINISHQLVLDGTASYV